MTLSWATMAEADALAAVHAEGFDKPWSATNIAELFTGPGVFGFLATDAASPVGMILVRVAADDAEVLTIATAKPARRKGVARSLVQAAITAAREAGADAMFLEVAVDNAPAASLYAACGFRRIATRTGYYDRGPQGLVDALVMRLDLNAEPA